MSDIRTRFLEVYSHLLKVGLTTGYKDFAFKISVSPSMITEISKGRSNVGTTAIQNTVLSFPISADWLLTGRGSMLCNEQEQLQPIEISTNPTQIVQIFMTKLDEKESKIEELNQRVVELSTQLAKVCPEGLDIVEPASTKNRLLRKTQSANSDNVNSPKQRKVRI